MSFNTRGNGPPDLRGTYSLLVLNITFRTTPEDLFPYFDRYGKVADIYCPRDKRTGVSRGFAFVRYKYKDEAEKAADRLSGKNIDGREIVVQFAKYGRNDEPEREQSRGGHGDRVGSRYRERHSSRSRSPEGRRSPRRRSSDRRSPNCRRSRDRSHRRSRSRSPRRETRRRSFSADRRKASKSLEKSPKKDASRFQSRSLSRSQSRSRSRSRSRSLDASPKKEAVKTAEDGPPGGATPPSRSPSPQINDN